MDNDPTDRFVASRRLFLGGMAAAAAAVGACGKSGDRPFRFSGIPDADKDQLSRRYAAVADYLGKALGRPVEYVHVPDYTAAVVAMASGKIDAAWFGGVTAVQADQRTPAGVHFVAARPTDLRFRSYFIANQRWVADKTLTERTDRSPQTLRELAVLAPKLAEGSFSFGSKSSTSGHIMPRWFLSASEVGVDPATGFKGPPLYQLKGGHAATLRAVADGSVDFGVVNFAAWEAADKEIQASAPVVFVTPEYVDYCFVAHGGLDAANVASLRKALVGLAADNPEHTKVLEAFSTQRFVEVQKPQWNQIRAVLDALEKDGGLA